jgi:hypothetical protein
MDHPSSGGMHVLHSVVVVAAQLVGLLKQQMESSLTKMQAPVHGQDDLLCCRTWHPCSVEGGWTCIAATDARAKSRQNVIQ